MDPNTNTEENPATTVANAAMSGAAPVVTTTDPNAIDVNPEPTLQAPVLDPSALGITPEAPAAAANGSVTIAPSADFQMGAVSTVSAVQNGSDGNLAASADTMVGQTDELESSLDNATIDQLKNTDLDSSEEKNPSTAVDFNDPQAAAAAEAAAKTSKDEEDDDDEPLVAAKPVPGSIGSAKSYSDIQRAEAEKAAKVAARLERKGKMDKKTLIAIIAGAVVAVIGIGVGAFVLMSGNGQEQAQVLPTPTTYPDDGDHEYSTLACARILAPEEYASYGAISGEQENIFYFQDDELNGLVTNFSYTYASKALSDVWRDKLAADYGVTPNDGVSEDDAIVESEEEEEESEEKKTTTEMLVHYVNTKDLTVTHGMMIKSVDIKDWLESDAYSDVTYGATSNGASTSSDDEEPTDDITRNLDYYNRLQNSIGYTCNISKGY